MDNGQLSGHSCPRATDHSPDPPPPGLVQSPKICNAPSPFLQVMRSLAYTGPISSLFNEATTEVFMGVSLNRILHLCVKADEAYLDM